MINQMTVDMGYNVAQNSLGPNTVSLNNGSGNFIPCVEDIDKLYRESKLGLEMGR